MILICVYLFTITGAEDKYGWAGNLRSISGEAKDRAAVYKQSLHLISLQMTSPLHCSKTGNSTQHLLETYLQTVKKFSITVVNITQWGGTWQTATESLKLLHTTEAQRSITTDWFTFNSKYRQSGNQSWNS